MKLVQEIATFISSLEMGQKQLANDKHVLETFVHFYARKMFDLINGK